LTLPRSGETVGTYAHPETLVSTDWVADHANDPTVRIVEVDEDVHLHEAGHINGAIVLDWHSELQDPVEREPAASGIAPVNLVRRNMPCCSLRK
jgi:3-mercaptopyruvate sulfurtransferase SseA